VVAVADSWHLKGEWFDVCSCNLPCPCTFAQAPTGGDCRFAFVWRVHEGRYADVQLDGLGALALGEFEGNAWEAGRSPMVDLLLYIDERGDEQQRKALVQIFTGQAGGWPAIFASLVRDLRGIEYAPIDWDAPDDLSYWRAEVPGRAKLGAVALTGPTSDPGQRVQLLNAPGSEVGPGQVATWGVVTDDDANGLRFFSSEYRGASSKHIPFEWRSE
jgi:hypothetical protein